ncbi:hypothetical protein M9Y10_016570 [Tritrichomonas musculus]|uniref:adenylate cyclase n=1 Tax=Tritrichomonas musculus TaxID=1915356 RepID=A0ABR2HWN1_9EUKA
MSESSRISYNTLTYSTPLQLTSLGYFSNDKFFYNIAQNSFFPLFTEISRFCHLPHFFDGIQLLLMTIQEIGVTNWCGSLEINRQRNSFFDILFWFTDWGIVRTTKIDDCIIQYLIGFGLFLITNLFLLFIILFYQQTHNFYKSHLYIIRFLFFPLLSYLIPIYGCFLGRSFTELMTKESNAISITLFIFSIPVFLISLHELYFVNKFSTDTPVIDQSLIGTWDDQLIFLTILSISLGSTLQIILDIFPKWLRVSALVGYIIFLFYRIYLLYFAPMLRYWMNSLFLSTCGMSIINCVFSIVHIFVTKIPSWAFIFISIAFFLIFCIIAFFWYRSKKIKYLRHISYSWSSDNEIPNEMEKREHFDKIVFSSARDAISFIHIGVMFQADSIVDFSFLRYLIENYAEPSIVIAVSKVASFFPSETRFLNFCLTEVSKICRKSIFDDFLIYQMRLILVIRQSSVSAEASTQLGVLQKMSFDTISQVRGFWAEILNSKTDISFASLQYLRKITMSTDSAFLDACDRFPNNASILNEYCRFQIEGMGNFLGSISSSKKMFLLDQGKNLTIDHVFKALVNVYPDYLLKNIFTIHGNLIGNGLPRDQSSFSISSTITTQEDFEEKYEEIVSQLYLHGKLRVALQLRMKSTKLWSFQLSLILSIIQLLFCVVIYILIIFLFPISSKNALTAIESCNEFSKVSLRLQYISCIVGIRTAIKKRAFSGVNMLRSQLGISSSDLKSEPSFFQNPEIAIFNSTRKLREQFDISTRALISSMSNTVGNLTVFLEENIEYIREKNSSQFLSIQSSIAKFCYTAEVLSTIISTSSNDIDRLSEELLINTNTITNSLELLQISLNAEGIESVRNVNNYIKYIGIFVILIGCFLILCLRIYNLIIIYNQTKQSSNLLRKIDPELIKESFQPILLKGHKEPIKGNNPHSAHEYDFLLVLHPIIIAISIIASTSLSTISIIYFFDSLNITDSVFQWFLYGNVRSSSILGSLVVLCAGSTNAIDHDTEYSILKSKTNLLFISQKYIDLTLMQIDPEINRLYFSKQCDDKSVSSNSYKEYAECLSLSSKIYVATSAIQNLVEDDAPMILNNQDFAILIYLVDTFLFEELERFQQLIVHFSFNHFESSSMKTLAMCISGLTVSVLVFLIEESFFVKFQQSVDAIKQLISMLPPVAVATSTVLMNFINNGENNEDSEVTLTASESVISMTSTPALMLNKEKNIQAVNKAVNKTTGFLPDQILGQNVKWLIPPPSVDYGQKVRDMNRRFYQALYSFTGEKFEEFDIRPNMHSNSAGTVNEGDSLATQIESDGEDEADLILESTMAVTTAPTVGTPVNSSRSAIQKERCQTDNDNNQANSTFSIRKNSYTKIPETNENVIVLTAMCLTESGSIIPAQTTIIYIKDRLTENDSYVILLRDVSKENEMIRMAQETRLKTSRLLTSLIPQSLVSSILSMAGQTDARRGRRSRKLSDIIDSKSMNDSKESEMNIGSRDDSMQSAGAHTAKHADNQGSKAGGEGQLKAEGSSQNNAKSEANQNNENKEEDVNHSNNTSQKEDVESSKNEKQESEVNLLNNDTQKVEAENSKSDIIKEAKDPNNENNESEVNHSNNKGEVNHSNEQAQKSEVEKSNNEKQGSEVDLSNDANKEKDSNELHSGVGVQKEGSGSGAGEVENSGNLVGSSLPQKGANESDDSEEYKSVKIENDDDSEDDIKPPATANDSNESDSSDERTNYTSEISGSLGNEEAKADEPAATASERHEEAETKDQKENDNSELREETYAKDTTNYSLNSMNSAKDKSKSANSFTKEIEMNNVFSSDFATVIFIQIIGLNDYVHILSPKQLLNHLKVIYDEFDRSSKEYPAVSILKMNTEQIIACCGLFSYFDDQKEQARQAVLYSLKMIKKIELINEDLDIDLHLRIGINAGGPIIGSMLSPMIPSFEIFGEFISLTKRIQSKGEVGFVNVSQLVANQLESSDFKIEKGITLNDDIDEKEITIFNVKPIANNDNI